MDFLNTLNWWQWTILGIVPPAIVALYFLKLKREPLEIPSTYLWRKSIEDLHVNSIWQRLRQNLLLLLQLLLIALAALALLRPGWRGAALSGDRFIFMVDHSASMSATDVSPSRLEEAKRRVLELIEQMGSGSKAMILSFADSAQVVQEFTDNRRLLRERLQAIKPTSRGTSLAVALQMAAGLANPGRIATEEQDQIVADALPAHLYLFSDGKFDDADTTDFSLGNLTPTFVPIGQPQAGNVAITAFSARQHGTADDAHQAFGQIENLNKEEVTVTAELYLNDELVDADELTLDGEGAGSLAFDLGDVEEGDLRLEVKPDDALALDNVAYATLNTPRPGRVLFVSPGNEAVELALVTGRARRFADVEVVGVDRLSDKTHLRDAASGSYDLIIYDQCQPTEMPQANTFFIGRLPPIGEWKGDEEATTVSVPQIIDTDRVHPVMQLIEMMDIAIGESLVVEPPPGSTVLVFSNRGDLCAIGPRGGYEDLVLGFEVLQATENGQVFNTNWPLRHLSFPTFLLNVLEYLGGGHRTGATLNVRPGQPALLKSTQPTDVLTIRTPDGRIESVARGRSGIFQFNATEATGIYEVQESRQVTQRFPVNLFLRSESNIKPRPENTIQIGHVDVEGKEGWEPARRELWKWVLLAALAVLLFEWYIYNRRVYI